MATGFNFSESDKQLSDRIDDILNRYKPDRSTGDESRHVSNRTRPCNYVPETPDLSSREYRFDDSRQFNRFQESDSIRRLSVTVMRNIFVSQGLGGISPQ